MIVGDERIADGLGLEIGMELSGVMFRPALLINSAHYSDPLPARDDLVDPFLLEIVNVSDRSTRIFDYGLGLTYYKTLQSDFR